MPLSVSVDEAITQAVFERLELVPFVTAVRQTRELDEWTPEDSQIVLVKQHPTRITELDCPGNPPALGWQIELRIRMHILASEHEETPPEELLSNLNAETIRTITALPQWYQWGGLALDTQFGDTETIASDGGFDAMMLPLLITYRVSENNPYEVRA